MKSPSITTRNAAPFVALLFLTVFSACAKKGKLNAKPEEVKQEADSVKMNLSAKTKLFLADYRKELNVQKAESFQPSKALVEKYSLLKQDEESYQVKGFAIFTKEFDPSQLSELDVTIGSKLGKQTTLLIPLENFNDFLNQSHIDYFEIAEKAQLKQ